MKTETIHLSQIQVNGANPRIIKNDKFEKLIGLFSFSRRCLNFAR